MFRGDECVSLGWCFWHRACYGCLFCGNRGVVTAPGIKELFEGEGGGRVWEVDDEGEEGKGMGMGGREKGREIDNIPMCANCAIACQNDDRDALVKRALRRIEVADGGLSWQRWKTRCKNKSSRSATAIAARQSHLGGDSSMDVVSSSTAWHRYRLS